MDIQNENGPDDFNELDVLFEMVEERNRKLDEQLKNQIETRRSVERTLRQEEEQRLRNLNRLGSYDQAAAVARENARRSAFEKDADRRTRQVDKDIETRGLLSVFSQRMTVSSYGHSPQRRRQLRKDSTPLLTSEHKGRRSAGFLGADRRPQ